MTEKLFSNKSPVTVFGGEVYINLGKLDQINFFIAENSEAVHALSERLILLHGDKDTDAAGWCTNALNTYAGINYHLIAFSRASGYLELETNLINA